MTANLDKMYMDRLTGLLAESDFERIYQRVKMERSSLEEKLKELESQKESPVSTEDRARELVSNFWTLPIPAGNSWSVSSSVWN